MTRKGNKGQQAGSGWREEVQGFGIAAVQACHLCTPDLSCCRQRMLTSSPSFSRPIMADAMPSVAPTVMRVSVAQSQGMPCSNTSLTCQANSYQNTCSAVLQGLQASSTQLLT